MPIRVVLLQHVKGWRHGTTVFASLHSVHPADVECRQPALTARGSALRLTLGGKYIQRAAHPATSPG